MVEMEEIKRIEHKINEAVKTLTRRMEAVERTVDSFYDQLEKIKNEDIKVMKELEERVSDIEDLQIITRLELIKIREHLKKTPLGGFSDTFQPKIDEIEERISRLERKIEGGVSLENNGSSYDFDEIKDEIKKLKESIESVRKETEESIAKLSMIIKKLVDNL